MAAWIKKNKALILSIVITILQNTGVLPTADKAVSASTNPIGVEAE